jgi:large conductance mechanosensitive channel
VTNRFVASVRASLGQSTATEENMLKTLRGFKDFMLRGNVVELAVGIVIGAAFTALVGSFTEAFIKPLLQLFGAGKNEIGGQFHIGAVPFPYSTFINGAVTFVISAAVLYFLVVTPMNKFAERRKRGVEPEPPKPSEEILLLREIRDALQGRGGAPSSRRPTVRK